MSNSQFNTVIYTNEPNKVTYWRQPTAGEIRFGEGAIHYKDFDLEFVVKPDGNYKKWIKCPYDGLRYNN